MAAGRAQANWRGSSNKNADTSTARVLCAWARVFFTFTVKLTKSRAPVSQSFSGASRSLRSRPTRSPCTMYAAIVASTLSFGLNNIAADSAMTRRQSMGCMASAWVLTTPAVASARNNFATPGVASSGAASSSQPNQPQPSPNQQQEASKSSSNQAGGKPAAPTASSSQDDDLRRLGLKPMSDVDQCFTSTGRPYNCRP